MKKIIFKNLLLQNPWRRTIAVSEITSEADTVTEAERGAIYILERVANVMPEPPQFYVFKKENDKSGEYEFCYEAHRISFAVRGNDIYKITRINYHRLKITELKIAKRPGG